MAHREMRGLQVGMHIHPFLDGTAWWQSVIQEFSGTSITHPNALVLKAFHILIQKKKIKICIEMNENENKTTHPDPAYFQPFLFRQAF